MPTLKLKSYHAKPSDIQRDWFIIDASGQTVGRLASRIAHVLRGKHKPQFTPSVDTGDFVVIINASQIRVSGKKEVQKVYTSFSGYVGGHKSETFKSRIQRHPELVVERAVRGMIPHNRLGRSIYTKLKVYSGNEHPHASQQPAAITLK